MALKLILIIHYDYSLLPEYELVDVLVDVVVEGLVEMLVEVLDLVTGYRRDISGTTGGSVGGRFSLSDFIYDIL